MRLILDVTTNEYRIWLAQQPPSETVGWEELKADLPFLRFLREMFRAYEVTFEEAAFGPSQPGVCILYDPQSSALPPFFPTLAMTYALIGWSAELCCWYLRQGYRPRLSAGQALNDLDQLLQRTTAGKEDR